MKFKSTTTTLAALTVALATPAVQAAGMIVVDPIVGGVMPRPVPVTRPGHPVPVLPGVLKGRVSFGLRLQEAEVKVDVTDQVAKTYITQTFVNDTDQNLAGTYLFPLPEDTTFSSFSLHIDGKPIEGKILEAQDARRQYEAIVRSMVDPGLLEFADYKTVRARIFPIPARGTKKVELEYTQVLKAENGMIKYRFPLKAEGESAATEEVKINVKLNSKVPIRTIWSPSHVITSNRNGENKALISFAGKDLIPDKDFLLYYSVSDKDLTANLLTQKNSGEDGYFLLTLSPPVQSKQVISKDIVLVADTSGSMKGERMEQTKKALKYLVNALSPADRFAVVRFATDVDCFKPGLLAATPENKKAALEFIDDLEAAGGTNIGDALKTASNILGGPSEQRPAYLVLMTDGEPTVGETTTAGLLKAVGTKRDIRLFDFGVGYDLNTRLLNKLAEEHHGTSQYVEPNQNIEVELSSFYDKIKAPVLSDVKITYNGVTVKDVYPRAVKDIFAGNQVLLMGKYKGSGNATVQLTGTVNGVSKSYSFPLKFEEAQTGHGYLPRLWAMRRIGHLTEIAQENGDNKEVVDEIIDLSKRYGIISAYTSFLVTDPSESNRQAGRPDLRRDIGALPPTTLTGLRARRAPFEESAGSPAPSAPGDSMRTAGASGMYRAERAYINADKEAFAKTLSAAPVSGRLAVAKAKAVNDLKSSVAAKDEDNAAGVKAVGDKTFYLKNGFWTDSAYDEKKSPKVEVITFGTKEYFDLVSVPGLAKYLAVGRQVVLLHGGRCYKIIFKADA